MRLGVSGIVLNLCQIVRIYRGNPFQANIKVGMQLVWTTYSFIQLLFGSLRHRIMLLRRMQAQLIVRKYAHTMNMYIYIYIILIVYTYAHWHVSLDALICLLRRGVLLPSQQSSKWTCRLLDWILKFMNRWADELEDIGRCQTTVIYSSSRKVYIFGLKGLDFSSVKSKGWVIFKIHLFWKDYDWHRYPCHISQAVHSSESTQSKRCLMSKSVPSRKGFYGFSSDKLCKAQ